MTDEHITEAGIDTAAFSWRPEDACTHWEHCRNRAPVNGICDECLSEVRERDRKADYETYAEYMAEEEFPP